MKSFYLLLAIIGTILPYAFFVQHVGAEGYALPAFLAGVFATPAASGFAADLVVSSLVFWFWMFTADAPAPKPWVFIALNLLIGLSCALPAWLYWRERGRAA